jgi:hypothetical protein
MYYGHESGAIMRLLSRPRLHAFYERGRRAANALAGRWGNKLLVTALRRAA